jgi:hypothetical protein
LYGVHTFLEVSSANHSSRLLYRPHWYRFRPPHQHRTHSTTRWCGPVFLVSRATVGRIWNGWRRWRHSGSGSLMWALPFEVLDIALPPLAQQGPIWSTAAQGGPRGRLHGEYIEGDDFLKYRARKHSSMERLDRIYLYCNQIRAGLSGHGLLFKGKERAAGFLSTSHAYTKP